MLTLNCAIDDVIEHSSKASAANAWRMMDTSGVRGPPKAAAVNSPTLREARRSRYRTCASWYVGPRLPARRATATTIASCDENDVETMLHQARIRRYFVVMAITLGACATT